jgi:hypothetical protein
MLAGEAYQIPRAPAIPAQHLRPISLAKEAANTSGYLRIDEVDDTAGPMSRSVAGTIPRSQDGDGIGRACFAVDFASVNPAPSQKFTRV